MNTDLEAVTFKAVTKAQGGVYYSMADGICGSGKTALLALCDLYTNLTEHLYSFCLQVIDNGQVVQELVYREAH
jgi:hypothetical protein